MGFMFFWLRYLEGEATPYRLLFSFLRALPVTEDKGVQWEWQGLCGEEGSTHGGSSRKHLLKTGRYQVRQQREYLLFPISHFSVDQPCRLTRGPEWASSSHGSALAQGLSRALSSGCLFLQSVSSLQHGCAWLLMKAAGTGALQSWWIRIFCQLNLKCTGIPAKQPCLQGGSFGEILVSASFWGLPGRGSCVDSRRLCRQPAASGGLEKHLWKDHHAKHSGLCSWWTGPSQDTNGLVAITQECHQGINSASLDIVSWQACKSQSSSTPGLFSSKSLGVHKTPSFAYRLCDAVGLTEPPWICSSNYFPYNMVSAYTGSRGVCFMGNYKTMHQTPVSTLGSQKLWKWSCSQEIYGKL